MANAAIYRTIAEFERSAFFNVMHQVLKNYNISLHESIQTIENPIFKNTAQKVSYIDQICTYTVLESNDQYKIHVAGILSGKTLD